MNDLPIVVSAMKNIFTKAGQGDKAAEAELIEYLSVRFAYLAKRRVRGEDAIDIAQEACLTVLQKYREDAPRDHPEAWAYTILRNKIGNYYQKTAGRPTESFDTTGADGGAGMSAPTVDPEAIRKLRSCLRKLVRAHPRYARVLNLAYQGYTSNEISRRLGIRTSNFYMMLNRGRSRLRQCMKGEWPK